jgi:hypothetical protein
MRDVLGDLESLERILTRFCASYRGFPPGAEKAAHEAAFDEAVRLERALGRFREAASISGPAERLARCAAEADA